MWVTTAEVLLALLGIQNLAGCDGSLIPLKSSLPTNELENPWVAGEATHARFPRSSPLLASKDESGDAVSLPRSVQTQKKNNVINLDLSNPTVNLKEAIEEVLASRLSDFKITDKQRKINLSMNITPPPKATIEFVRAFQVAVRAAIRKIIPFAHTSFRISFTRSSTGEIIRLKAYLKVSSSSFTRTPSNVPEIDLTEGSTHLSQSLRTILLRELYQEGYNPASKSEQKFRLSFSILPPEGTTKNFFRLNILPSLQGVLKSIAPGAFITSISLNTRRRNQRIFKQTVRFSVQVVPSVRTEEEVPEVNLNIPGTDVVSTVVTTVQNQIGENMNVNATQSRTVSINFKITPPKGATQQQINEMYITPISQELSRIDPTRKILNIGQKSLPNGDVVLVVTINIPANTTLTTFHNGEIQTVSSSPWITSTVEPPVKTRSVKQIPILLGNRNSVDEDQINHSDEDESQNSQEEFSSSVQYEGASTTVEPPVKTRTAKQVPSNVPEIDLTEGSTHLSQSLRTILLRELYQEGYNPASKSEQKFRLSFSIWPPEGTTKNFFRLNILPSLQEVLKSIAPGAFITSISLNTRRRNHMIFKQTVRFSVQVVPSVETEEEVPEVNLNVPGTDIVSTVVTTVQNQIRENMNVNPTQSRTVSIHFKISPPKGATQQQINEMYIIPISQQLSRIDPTGKILNIGQKSLPNGDVVLVVTINIPANTTLTTIHNGEIQTVSSSPRITSTVEPPVETRSVKQIPLLLGNRNSIDEDQINHSDGDESQNSQEESSSSVHYEGTSTAVETRTAKQVPSNVPEIDLTEGSTHLSQSLRTILLRELYQEGYNPASKSEQKFRLSFSILPPEGTTENFFRLNILPSLQGVLKSIAPGAFITSISLNTQRRNQRIFKQTVRFSIQVVPSVKTEEEVPEVNLNVPGTDIVSTVVTSVQNQIRENMNVNPTQSRTVSINFKITPPVGATQQQINEMYITPISQELSRIDPTGKILNIGQKSLPNGDVVLVATINIPANTTLTTIHNGEIQTVSSSPRITSTVEPPVETRTAKQVPILLGNRNSVDEDQINDSDGDESQNSQEESSSPVHYEGTSTTVEPPVETRTAKQFPILLGNRNSVDEDQINHSDGDESQNSQEEFSSPVQYEGTLMIPPVYLEQSDFETIKNEIKQSIEQIIEVNGTHGQIISLPFILPKHLKPSSAQHALDEALRVFLPGELLPEFDVKFLPNGDTAIVLYYKLPSVNNSESVNVNLDQPGVSIEGEVIKALFKGISLISSNPKNLNKPAKLTFNIHSSEDASVSQKGQIINTVSSELKNLEPAAKIISTKVNPNPQTNEPDEVVEIELPPLASSRTALNIKNAIRIQAIDLNASGANLVDTIKGLLRKSVGQNHPGGSQLFYLDFKLKTSDTKGSITKILDALKSVDPKGLIISHKISAGRDGVSHLYLGYFITTLKESPIFQKPKQSKNYYEFKLDM